MRQQPFRPGERQQTQARDGEGPDGRPGRVGAAVTSPPAGEQRHRAVPARGQQREQHTPRAYGRVPAAEDEDSEPREGTRDGDGSAPAQAFGQDQPGAERDEHGPGAQGDDGGDGEAGGGDGREVGGLEDREPDPGDAGPQRPAAERLAHGRPGPRPHEADGEQQHKAGRAAPEGEGDGPHVTGPVDQGGGGARGAPGDTGDDQIEEASPDGQAGGSVRHVFSPQTRTTRRAERAAAGARKFGKDPGSAGSADFFCGQHRSARRRHAGRGFRRARLRRPEAEERVRRTA